MVNTITRDWMPAGGSPSEVCRVYAELIADFARGSYVICNCCDAAVVLGEDRVCPHCGAHISDIDEDPVYSLCAFLDDLPCEYVTDGSQPDHVLSVRVKLHTAASVTYWYDTRSECVEAIGQDVFMRLRLDQSISGDAAQSIYELHTSTYAYDLSRALWRDGNGR